MHFFKYEQQQILRKERKSCGTFISLIEMDLKSILQISPKNFLYRKIRRHDFHEI